MKKLFLFIALVFSTPAMATVTTQADVVIAQIAVAQNQLAGIDLQATAQKEVLQLRISQLQAQLVKLQESQ